MIAFSISSKQAGVFGCSTNREAAEAWQVNQNIYYYPAEFYCSHQKNG